MKKIGILGCGNMGGAFLRSLLENEIYTPDEIIVCNRTQEKNEKISSEFSVATTTDPAALVDCSVIILGIKPQGLADLDFQPRSEALILSLLVGTTVRTLKEKFQTENIVRLMPNIGQYEGFGATGIYAENISHQNKKIVQKIVSAGARAVWLNEEEKINHFAAVAGSGPAYYFLFSELLQKSAEKLGFDVKVAEQMVRQTFIGAAELIKKNEVDFQTYREMVTSPGGTTQAAIRSFLDSNLDEIFHNATQAACDRGDEIARMKN